MSADSDRNTRPDAASDSESGGQLLRSELVAVEAFATAWAAAINIAPDEGPGPLPEITAFLPDARTLRREALIELIRVDMRHRWLRRPALGARRQETPPPTLRRKRLAEYCAEFPELERENIPASLVYEEFVVRRQSGERVDPRECLREYPSQAAELRGLLNADDVDQSTRRTPPEAPDDSTRPSIDGTNTAAIDETRESATDDSTRAAFDGTMPATGTDQTSALNRTTAPVRGTEVNHTAEATRAADLGGTETAIGTTMGTGPGRLDPLDRIEIGQRVDDFDLLTGLGSGAFARVFLARQRSMQRLVAVKISADHGTEPQTLAQLDHDYIVRVFDQRLLDAGEADGTARRLRLLYMQFLPGGTLLGVLRWVRATPPEERSGQLLLDAVDAAMEEKGEIRPTDSSVRAEIAALSWPETVAWLGRRLAEALDYASAHGVLHRDVKPANVLLTAEAVPKLADFNISFSRNVEGTSPVAYFGGSLAYMSPEQLEACHPGRARSAADLDTRSDIFSLGVVLWELLTGAKPYDDSTAGAGQRGDDTTLEAMLERRCVGVDAAALARIPKDCPAALRRVLLTCLQPERSERWSNGATLAKQLDLCLDERARGLVDPKPGSWRERLQPYILPVMVVAIAVPNMLASLYNIQHNQNLIVERMPEDAQRTFLIITGLVNAVFFPIGFITIIYSMRYMLRVTKGLRHGKRYDPDTLRRARTDTLLLGERAVAIPFLLWVLAALTFPVAMELSTGDVTGRDVVHFMASLVVCGAIAASYPFFLATFYLIRCIYPIFLRHGNISPEDAGRLRALDRRCNLYLAIAASVPLLAVAGVTFLPPEDIPMVIVAVRVLCAGAIIAFIGSYLLFRALEADLRALERVVAPSGEPGAPAAQSGSARYDDRPRAAAERP
ncbi:Serine/threonine protein kinase [Nocardia amikacinitolerans]|uniref:Serine/threonine protein kinase n=1 Tax=Nocardia amikacinitolerans TaxID=756689 RepID=A0A285LVI0_9NOCA|nr:serine/threonine-protein kinase [Nocardia amikacinitolerans]MCP2278256.1 Serine/threonine protein kinase [Nocardia amikacinitolerans]MCP2299178.1 Serine/threonine protein kinase [Nocardia amikacinitolerans]SNY88922.1 Serine/threonine protein kinase [Nocardia amikacinitolerans]